MAELYLLYNNASEAIYDCAPGGYKQHIVHDFEKVEKILGMMINNLSQKDILNAIKENIVRGLREDINTILFDDLFESFRMFLIKYSNISNEKKINMFATQFKRCAEINHSDLYSQEAIIFYKNIRSRMYLNPSPWKGDDRFRKLALNTIGFHAQILLDNPSFERDNFIVQLSKSNLFGFETFEELAGDLRSIIKHHRVRIVNILEYVYIVTEWLLRYSTYIHMIHDNKFDHEYCDWLKRETQRNFKLNNLLNIESEET